MPSSISLLYEPLIARDVAAIPAAVSRFRETESSDTLFQAVARFTFLAFAPTEHGRAAIASILAIFELKELLDDHFDDWVTEAAIYTSQSRLPWSEPPISEPPAVTDPYDATTAGIREAIQSRDRHRAERWLAGRIQERDFGPDFFLQAAESLADGGSGLTLAVNAWKLAAVFGERERYPILRTVVWQWTSEGAEPAAPRGRTMRTPRLFEQLRARMVASGGEPESFRSLLLLDAAQQVTELTKQSEVEESVTLTLERAEAPKPHESVKNSPGDEKPLEPYRLARDYGERISAAALELRFGVRFPSLRGDSISAAAAWNLENGPSFEDWSFA
ncbi:MAG TPA: hypothetical protein VNM92_06045 [Thermoanaerobaculia bacterium]|nr:hypothetical protein [Thermoanaerobaculia bacterium]